MALPDPKGEYKMSEYIPYIIIMAGVTYLIRMLPLTCFQKELKSPFIQSFLYYVPYAVLGAMTFPAVFTSAGNLIPSLIAAFVACLLAYKEKSLLVVASFACLCAYVINLILLL